jgi:hypothetical protein
MSKNQKKPRNKLVSKIADGNYKNQKASGCAACNKCMCSSCTGFRCPWIHRIYRYDTSEINKLLNRCRVCIERGLEMIHDCDFYSNPRKQMFFVKRKYVFRQKESKTDRILKELAELKKLLEGNRTS